MILENELKVELESYSKILTLLNDTRIEHELVQLANEPNDAVQQKKMRDRIDVLVQLADQVRTRLIQRYMRIHEASDVSPVAKGRPMPNPAEPMTD